METFTVLAGRHALVFPVNAKASIRAVCYRRSRALILTIAASLVSCGDSGRRTSALATSTPDPELSVAHSRSRRFQLKPEPSTPNYLRVAPSYPGPGTGCWAQVFDYYPVDYFLGRESSGKKRIAVVSLDADYVLPLPADFLFGIPAVQYSIDTSPPADLLQELLRMQDSTPNRCSLMATTNVSVGEKPNPQWTAGIYDCSFLRIIRGDALSDRLKKRLLAALPKSQSDLLESEVIESVGFEGAALILSDGLPFKLQDYARPLMIRTRQRLYPVVGHHWTPNPMCKYGTTLGRISLDTYIHYSDRDVSAADLKQAIRERLQARFQVPKLSADLVIDSAISADQLLFRRTDKLSKVLGPPYVELSTYLIQVVVDSHTAGLQAFPTVMLKMNANSESRYMEPNDVSKRRYEAELDATLDDAMVRVCSDIGGTIRNKRCRTKHATQVEQ